MIASSVERNLVAATAVPVAQKHDIEGLVMGVA
jgi:hypothetical protein